MVTPSVALLLALSSGFAVGASANVRTETQAGLIPSSNQESNPSLDFTLVPGGGLTLSKGTSAFNANYSLRMLRRFFVDVDGFIILHQASVGYSDTFGRGWRFVSTLSANLGSVDYAGASQFVGQTGTTTPGTGTTTPTTPTSPTSTGQTPDRAVIPLLTIIGSVGLQGTVGRNHTLGFNVRGNHQRPLGSAAADGTTGQAFSQQTGAGVSTSYGYSLTPNLSLTLSGGIDFNQSDGAQVPSGTTPSVQTYQSGNAQGGATYRFSQRVSGGATLGMLISEGTNGLLLSPVGSTSLNAGWIDTRALKMSSTLSATVDGQPNNITGSFEPRASVALEFQLGFGSDWTVAITGDFATPLPIDRTGDVATLNDGATETTLGASIPVQYRVSDAIQVEFGARAQTGATRLDAPTFAFQGESYTGYVAVSASTSTGR